MKPMDYNNQDGCHNCLFCFRYTGHEDPIYYRCTLGDTDPIPKCGMLNLINSEWERYTDEDLDEGGIDYIFYKWEEDRYVEGWGKCGSWKKYINED